MGLDLPWTKLSETQVREIKNKLMQKISHREISEMYGVSKSCISQISCGANWRHVS